MEYKLTFKKFSDSLKKNKLLGLKCKECGQFTCPPKITCQECGSTNLDIVELSGKGKIVTFTVNYVPGQGREVEAPILIIMVEMDEGPWVMGNLTNIDPNEATMEIIGKRVKLASRSKIYPGDAYCIGGKEVEGGEARPSFISA